MVCSIFVQYEKGGLVMAFLDELLSEIEPYRQRSIEHPLLRAIESGSLSWDQLRAFGQYMYHFLIEGELRFSSISVVRSPDRESLRRNADHAYEEIPHIDLYEDFLRGLEIPDEEIGTLPTEPGIECFTNYFYRLSFSGSPAEAAAGAGLCEGMFADISARVAKGLRERYNLPLQTTRYWDVHAVADEEHLQLHHWRIQRYTNGPEMEQRVRTAARLGFSYWLMLFDTIAQLISLSTTERLVFHVPQ
jgi:thiaminase